MAAATPIVLRLSSRDRDDLCAGGGAPVPPAIPGAGAPAPGIPGGGTPPPGIPGG